MSCALDAGQERVRRDDCDVSRIAADGLELIRPLATARGIQMQAETGITSTATFKECSPLPSSTPRIGLTSL